MKKNITLFFISLLLFTVACNKKKTIVNLNNNTVSVLGHAGMGSDSMYPNNSFESLSKCINQNADGVEIDLQMTKDSVLVLFHDEDLTRLTTGEGKINSLNFTEIENLRYDEILYQNYKIISLEELLSKVKSNKRYIFSFDCKFYISSDYNSYINAFSNKLASTINKYSSKFELLVESSNIDFLKMLKYKGVNTPLFFQIDNTNKDIDMAFNENLFGIVAKNKNITASDVTYAHSKNLRVAIWGMYSRFELTDALKKCPDYVQSENVKLTKRLLN